MPDPSSAINGPMVDSVKVRQVQRIFLCILWTRLGFDIKEKKTKCNVVGKNGPSSKPLLIFPWNFRVSLPNYPNVVISILKWIIRNNNTLCHVLWTSNGEVWLQKVTLTGSRIMYWFCCSRACARNAPLELLLLFFFTGSESAHFEKRGGLINRLKKR